MPGTLHVGGLQGLSGDRFASYYPLIIWDARTRTVLHELTHSWDVYVRAVVELPGNRLFANITPGYNGPPPYECFRVYDLVSGKILQEFNETKDFLSSVMWADFVFADGHLIVSSRDRGINGCMTLHVWPEGPDGMVGTAPRCSVFDDSRPVVRIVLLDCRPSRTPLIYSSSLSSRPPSSARPPNTYFLRMPSTLRLSQTRPSSQLPAGVAAACSFTTGKPVRSKPNR